MTRSFYIALVAGIALLPLAAGADPGLPAVAVTEGPDGGQTWSVSIQILMLMTALTLLPSLVLAATSFTRIVIVLAILRQAIGMPTTPPNQVLIGLALFLSFFVIARYSRTFTNGASSPTWPATWNWPPLQKKPRARCAASC